MSVFPIRAVIKTQERLLRQKNRYIGSVFNSLTVIDVVKNSKNRAFSFVCRCVCGKETLNRKDGVISNSIKSCGCYRKQIGHLNTLPNNESALNKLILRYKLSAKKRKLDFSLTKDVFKKLVGSKCAYCDSAPKMTVQCKNSSILYNGIDRVNNAVGYTIENCVPCCDFCNHAKKNLSVSEFLQNISRVFSHLLENK